MQSKLQAQNSSSMLFFQYFSGSYMWKLHVIVVMALGGW